ncbi:MAG: hypothetical protein S4CHLAM45_03290 [Chlamydiales bacterium]|nr:hypothetical protein [Chlamydiales bacterium]MCH9619185.1 hypothetical protein [Chlamydiales bacterium]MCH9622447.1 hypothetical protein [Chlamydiales bacterium]
MSVASTSQISCLHLPQRVLGNCSDLAQRAGSVFTCAITSLKNAFASAWSYHTYPVQAAEYTISAFHSHITTPVGHAAYLTKEYFKNHYVEFFTHLFAWGILFSLCGVLSTQSFAGLSSVTVPMLTGAGYGIAFGIFSGIVINTVGTPSVELSDTTMHRLKAIQENIFLKAAAGATYVLLAGTVPVVIGAATAAFLGYWLITHIANYPEHQPTRGERIEALEATCADLHQQINGLRTKLREAKEDQLRTQMNARQAELDRLREEIQQLQQQEEEANNRTVTPYGTPHPSPARKRPNSPAVSRRAES